MKYPRNFLMIIFCIFFLTNVTQSQMKWITGYYPFWWYADYHPGVVWNGDSTGATGNYVPSMLDYSQLTHIVAFTGVGTSSMYPYCSYVTGDTNFLGITDSADLEFGFISGKPAPYLRTLIDSAHAHNVKVVISMGGTAGYGTDEMSAIAADSEKTEAFVTSSCAYAKRKGADGIEINWEFPYQYDQAGYTRLLWRFREELDTWNPRGIFLTTVYARTDENMTNGVLVDGIFFGYQRDTMLAVFDQINLETYTMWQGDDQDHRTGFNTPIDLPLHFENYNGYSLNDIVFGDGLGSVGTWGRAGYPIEKLGLGLSLETTEFIVSGQPTMGQPYDFFWYRDYKDVPDTLRYWDSVAASPYYAGNNTVVTYEDTTSIRIKIEWAKSNGFGGVMLYQLGGAYLPDAPDGQKDQLLRAAKSAVGDVNTPPTNVHQRNNISPTSYSLSQNFPNPFNPTTTIQYQLPKSSHVTLKIYNVLGQEVRTLIDEVQNQGKKIVVWNGKNNNGQHVSSGVYIYRIHSGEFSKTKKMILLE